MQQDLDTLWSDLHQPIRTRPAAWSRLALLGLSADDVGWALRQGWDVTTVAHVASGVAIQQMFAGAVNVNVERWQMADDLGRVHRTPRRSPFARKRLHTRLMVRVMLRAYRPRTSRARPSRRRFATVTTAASTASPSGSSGSPTPGGGA